MSSYRSYAPWKSTLGTTYKSGSSSAYSSRDDISTPRYTSLATPSTYRPSFSGGTYRIKREPPPPPVTPYVSRYASVTPKINKDSLRDSPPKSSQIKRYTSATSNLGKYGHSREPSPAAIERTNRITSREQSPVARTLRGKSRDPSPVIDTKCKIGYGGGNSYRMSTPRTSTTGYSSRYRSSATSMPDNCISYLSASDFRARSISRAKEIARKSSEKELEDTIVGEQEEKETQSSQIVSEITEECCGSESSAEEETFVAVSVVTRATSPTPPGNTTVVHSRPRRIDIAKTIEKTIQRSTRKKQMLEKEIQSDRMDDSTRYLRFGLSSSSRVSSYSPRYNASSLSSTVSKSSTSSSSCSISAEPRKEEETTSKSSSRSAAANKSKLSPPKLVRLINSPRQSSVENLTTANKPPAAPPKAESPTKSSSSSSNVAVRWPNKDFRKSALNVGPTDRPRKSRTPSSGTESDAVQQHRQERSPSAGSDGSNASVSSTKHADTKVRQRCHVKPNCGTTTTLLSRHNSSTNIKGSSHKSCTPPSSSISTSSSSSSGTDSSSENRKISKKNCKKKTQNTHIKEPVDSKSKKNNAIMRTGDSSDLFATSMKPSVSSENSYNEQPLAMNNDPQMKETQQTKIRTDSSSQSNSSKSPNGCVAAGDPKENTTNRRLQKLSSVSNFFTARQNDATNSDEPIFFESSESSGDLDTTNPLISNSLTEDFKTNTSPVKISTTTNSDAAASSTDSTSAIATRHFHLNLDSSEDNNLPRTQRSETKSSPNDTTTATATEQLTTDLHTEEDSPPNFTSTTSSTEEQEEEPSWWQDTSCQVNTASALDFNQKDEMRYKLRHIDSGEVAWWLRNDEDDTVADDDDDDLRTLNQEEDTVQSSSLRTHSSSGGHSWWTSDHKNGNNDNDNDTNDNDTNDNDQNVNEANKTNYCERRGSVEEQYNSYINSSGNNTKSNPLTKQNGTIHVKVCRVEEEQNDTNNVTVEAFISLPPKTEHLDEHRSSSSSGKNLKDTKHWWISEPEKKLFNVRRVESGEKAWWQQDETDEKKPQSQLANISVRNCDSGDRPWWQQDDEAEQRSTIQLQINESDDDEVGAVICRTDGDAEVQNLINNNGNFGTPINSNTELSNSFNFEYAERPPPLGQCASPVVDLEVPPPPQRYCSSPYDNNIPMSKVQYSQQQQQLQHTHKNGNAKQQHYNNNNSSSSQKLFISRHQNIDELLGGSCRPLSPLFFDDGNSFSTTLTGRNIFLEEITPDQVRIHDSSAQMPVIQRMDRDDWEKGCNPAPSANNGNAPLRFEQEAIDDASIQVYKDGDYGAYLDLESSLAEQAEEIEGLNTSRKNSLVVRTQLSVRVHAIIEKLISAEGSDLRRALFSLKQVFQEDKDLVHAFVALGGLNCLVRVGNGADQNYQNYILRALGQVMLYVDGMNGVMKHEPTMQWLYSLIASKYRSVVKTALKLLLVFVEYAETNCYVLVNAIHAVDKSQGTLPWSNIMRLLKDYDNADAELVIYATSLINKTLAGLNDQDSFYDESDLLEQQGMDSVIQRYMSKPGTDIDLLDQLQLYEAVLKFEDGESDGIRLPTNSLRKTQRYRPGTDTTERRKSRRHSTGTSPSVINKVIQSPKRLTPTNGVLDEDSSGSTNSTEFSGGLFAEQKSRDAAGVTPGLRRRRERAERHKSFLKEQQEAAANGIFVALEKREEMGQIVTAIPATVNNADSPPESLDLTNETTTNISNHPTTIISYPNITANATNNASCDSTATNSITTINNNNNSSNNLMSPSKQLLGSNTISIINNSFDKAHNNNINNGSTSHNNKLLGTPEFLTKKNLLMERNATVINGIMKNIQRGNESENTMTYKKYENDANRLNNYYSQLSQTTPKNQIQLEQNKTQVPNPNQNTATIQTAQSSLAAVLSPKKALNGFDFTQISSSSSSTPIKASLFTSEHQTPIEEKTTAEASFSQISPLSSPTRTTAQTTVIPDLGSYTTLNSPQYKTKAALTPPPPPPPPPDWGWSLSPVVFNPPKTLLANVPYSEELRDDMLQITESENEDRRMLQQLKRDHTVKDLTQKLSNMPSSPTQEDKLQNRIVGDMSGLISKAKEGLAKSKSKGEMSRSPSVDQEIKKSEPKKSENELHWEELVRNMSRSLNLCDLDFTDLNSDDEKDMLAPRSLGGGVPPPPPPFGGVPPPMMRSHIVCPPPMNNIGGSLIPPPIFSYSGYGNSSLTNSVNSSMNGSLNGDIGNSNTIKKNKKTVKLFWKEVREDMIPVVVGKTIWDELPSANVDTQKLEHLFESRAKDLMTKKHQDMNKSKEIIILDHKRSNAINIAMTKLPPPRAIKAAILKMDATVVTREGIDKLLNMLPTDEERGKIQEAQMANPELPLGSAEQFLLTLATISELGARLKLWAFRLDFDNSEKEIAEPLMDLKQGIGILRNNRTFKCILSTLLSVGIFLNGASVKGFQIEYLAKVPEVKDTVHKHSLLHHLCHMVMESCSDTTDLYSEIGPITRASKADFTDLAYNLGQMETECKVSWDRLKLIAKHDCPPQLKQKLVDFLADCAERIIILQIVHRRVINRYRKFLLWLGVPQHSVAESRPNEFCRIVSEFALEYRTTRERVQQQIEKKANHRERNKTRGKMIIDIAKFKTKEDHADAQLKELLGTPSADTADGTLTWRRRRAENLRSPIARQSEENFTDGDDEILESLVKTATKAPGTRTTPRERKRTRHADRKSLRRTLKNGLTEEEKQHVAALIKTY